MSEGYSEAYHAIAELAIALGDTPLHKHKGCWELQVDDRWWIAVNGHAEAMRCSRGVELGLAECHVEYNGWPAGSLNPLGGVFAAGVGANEDTFIAALRARLATVTLKGTDHGGGSHV